MFRKSLPEDNDNGLCPIKFVLILAIRSGTVYGNTIEAVLEHTKARADGTMQWRYPNRTVLCAAGPRRSRSQLGQGLSNDAISDELAHHLKGRVSGAELIYAEAYMYEVKSSLPESET